MKKFKKIIFIALILILWIIPARSFAVSFNLFTKSNNYQQGSEFYVDVLVDPQGQSINGIDGEISITSSSVLRIEDGGSVVKNWISRPSATIKGDTTSIVFSGITPNGFGGYANSNKKEGLVFRIVLKPQKNGQINLILKNLLVTKNDGEGTSIDVKGKSLTINISNSGTNEKYASIDTERPEVNYEIVNDQNLFEGKKSLVFSVIDSKSGFKNAYVKEGTKDFVLADSPYLLEDQSLRGIILLKVTDNAGNETLVTIRPTLYAYLPINSLSILALIVLVCVAIMFYIKNKKNKINANTK